MKMLEKLVFCMTAHLQTDTFFFDPTDPTDPTDLSRKAIFR